jgi:hypothetical protein
MPFTSIAQRDGGIELSEGRVIPFGDNDFVLSVGLVVLWRGFWAMAEGDEDMRDGGVLEVVGDVHWRMVELEDGDDSEDRNERWDQDGDQGEVGKDLRSTSLIHQHRPCQGKPPLCQKHRNRSVKAQERVSREKEPFLLVGLSRQDPQPDVEWRQTRD